MVPPVRKRDSVDYKQGVHAKKTSPLPMPHALPNSQAFPSSSCYLLEAIKNLDIGKDLDIGKGLRLREHDSQGLHTHGPQEVPSSDSVTQTSEKNLPTY